MSRNDYRPLNVRDALSYLDKVKVSNRISSSSVGPPVRERDRTAGCRCGHLERRMGIASQYDGVILFVLMLTS